ncbi:DNA-directed RNA polymerase II subunit RPB2 [Histomonas meleagridis]|uniref:DNA-directed RNA polymerase II subunit RPB2 n=1 Tax=Histomonas meleagridis TaxID=135588 RepID=UPI003559C6B7|nr:DNA-directed RNA polymerase II subunit RPB2 [Histomonas meleagridis]KAH0796454.1 DNA-directed RNA polymerase II subunit RPB2 [Histomonas meleagridis]
MSFNDIDPYSDALTQNDIWKIASSFFASNGLVTQQLRSYESLIDQQIDQIIADNGEIEFKSKDLDTEKLRALEGQAEETASRVFIRFGEINIVQPTCKEAGENESSLMFPMTARLRQLTYAITLCCDIETTIISIDGPESEPTEKSFVDGKVQLAKIPVMVRSKYCHLHNSESALNECEFDPGGYFIIKGSEKVIIGQEHMVINKPIVYSRKSLPKYDYLAEIRSQPLICGDISQKFQLALLAPSASNPNRPIHAKLPKMEKEVPLMILFRAFGIVSDEEILSHICYDLEDSEFMDMLRPTIEESSSIHDESIALDFIGKRSTVAGVEKERRSKKAREILDQYVLPHLGQKETDITKKAFYIGYMTHQLIQTALKRRDEDDRDHYSNKRLDLAGPLIASLFANLFRSMRDTLRKNIKRSAKADFSNINIPQQINESERSTNITKGLEYCIATGNWNARREVGGAKVGVSQALNRLTYMATLSNLRRTNTPIGKDAKLTKPRFLHNTHWGYICPVETPEGQACGLVKNLALLTSITVDRGENEIAKITNMLDDIGIRRIEEATTAHINRSTKIFVNGAWYGVYTEPNEIVRELLERRRQIDISSDVSIVHNIADQEIYIWCDGGRVSRPLLIVEDNQLRLKHSMMDQLNDWEDFLAHGFIEYLDIDEEENQMIAMTQKKLQKAFKPNAYSKTYTHCEIHPALVLGVCGSIIPFPDHNQSPRNTYQCAMGKQALGLYSTNFQVRMDSSSHVLWYPQKPLVTTRSMQYLHFKELPAGINCCVAIACYTGYNQEDSLMLNQSSIDRGLFRSFYYRTYKDVATDGQQFRIPTTDFCRSIRNEDHSHIDEDGIAIIGKHVSGEDIIIGKTVQDKSDLSGNTCKDESTEIRLGEKGIIDLVMRSRKLNGDDLVKVRSRTIRIPRVGDKFSSRHGQKGVCGMTYRQEDMPFTREGIVPDIIMNPHAIPSRMTIGQLMECLLGKVAALKGIEGDSTPFSTVKVEEIASELQSLGYERYGNEIFTNGRTGKRLRAKLFFGPTYYQRLKHMVLDKVHGRARGPKNQLLRQPLEGRSRNGGLRFGEMERDCLIAHGVAALLRDRLLENSDRYTVCVCRRCGLIAIETPEKRRSCKGCKENAEFAIVEMPYAFKLVLQELMSMCIAPRLKLTD